MFPVASHSQSVCRPACRKASSSCMCRAEFEQKEVCDVWCLWGPRRWWRRHKPLKYSTYVCKYVCIETTELPTQQCGSSVLSCQQNQSQHVTFELLVLCRFAFVRRQHMPAVHRPSCMISNVSSLNGAKQKVQFLNFKNLKVSAVKSKAAPCVCTCVFKFCM